MVFVKKMFRRIEIRNIDMAEDVAMQYPFIAEQIAQGKGLTKEVPVEIKVNIKAEILGLVADTWDFYENAENEEAKMKLIHDQFDHVPFGEKQLAVTALTKLGHPIVDAQKLEITKIRNGKYDNPNPVVNQAQANQAPEGGPTDDKGS